MNNKLLFAVIGVVLVAGIGTAVFMMSSKDEVTSTDVSQQSAGSESESESGNTSTESEGKSQVEGNLTTLAVSGKAQVCDMSYSGENGEGNGKMYTDGAGRGRITLDLATARGNQGQSNTLVKEDKVYSWTKTDSGSFGIVMDVSAIQTDSSGSPTTSNSQTAGKNFKMTCKKWVVDESVLTVPSDVNFTSTPVTQ